MRAWSFVMNRARAPSEHYMRIKYEGCDSLGLLVQTESGAKHFSCIMAPLGTSAIGAGGEKTK